MDYKKLNNALKIALERKKPIERVENHMPNGEDQGDEGDISEVYTTDIEGVFIQIKLRTDSYGDNEAIKELAFVKPTQKTITNYEPIN